MDRQNRLEELLVDWGLERQQGNELSVEEVCKNNPELVPELSKLIRDIKATDWLEEDDDSDDSFIHLPDFSTVSGHADEAQLPECKLSVEEYCQRLINSKLMDDEQVGQLKQRITANDARSFAVQLVSKKQLTRFQATVLLEGREMPLVLDRYVLLAEIGAGGMGAVYKALHQQMDRVVALKILPKEAVDSPDKVKRFQREVKAAAKLEHPNIVTAFDATESNGTHFLVMSYVKGNDLAETVRKQGSVSAAKAVSYITQAASGLEHAHKLGIVHRDIKPGNLLLDKKGNVQILDMGLARIENADPEYDKTVSQELTQAGMVMGTIAYMAPEQALDTSTADAQSDIYSLGCTLYYLLMGKAPYIEDTMMKTIMAHREADIPSLCGERNSVPAELDAIFQMMVAKQPEDRFQDMTEVITALDELEIEDKEEAQSVVAMSPAMHETAIFIDTSQDVIEQQPSSESFGPPWRQWPLIAAGVLGAVVLLSGLIIHLSTPAGMVILEVDQPELIGAVVKIDGEKRITIKTGKGQEGIEIRPDAKRHELEVAIAGFKTFARYFTFETGNRQTIRVHLDPLKPQVAKDTPATNSEYNWPRDQPSGRGDEKPQTTNKSQDAVLVAIKELGGRVGFDEKNPDKPVVVDLGDSDVTDASLVHLRDLTSLQRLNLTETQVTDAGLVHLNGLTGLQTLTLHKTQVTPTGVKDIQAALPKCRIGPANALVSRPSDLDASRGVVAWASMIDAGGTFLTYDSFQISTNGNVGMLEWEGIYESVDLSANPPPASAYGFHITIVEDAGGEPGLMPLPGSGSFKISNTGSSSATSHVPNGDARLLHLPVTPDEVTETFVRDIRFKNSTASWYKYRIRLSNPIRLEAGKMYWLSIAAKTNSKDGRPWWNWTSGHDQNASGASLHIGKTGKHYERDRNRMFSIFSSGVRQNENAALVAIEELGGRVVFDEKNPDKPVVVDLVGSDVTDASLIHLRGLTSLQTLNLTETHVTDAGLVHLKGLTALKKLTLHNTRVTPTGVKDLQSELPRCRIGLGDALMSRPSGTLTGHTGLVKGVAYSPDGTRVASASFDRTVKVWNTATMQETLTLKGHTDAVSKVAFSPDGQRLASASGDETVKVWDAATGQESLTLKGHTTAVWSVAFSPDGMRLASGDFDGTVRVWDAMAGKSAHTLLGHTDRVYGVAFSPDGKRLASASWDSTVKVWDATGLELLVLQGHTGRVWCVTFSPDGTQLASGGDKTAKIWDAVTGQETLTLNATHYTVTDVAFSPDGTRLATASDDKMVKIWDVATGQERKTLKGHTGYVQSVAFNPDGTQLVSASADQTVRIWDVSPSKGDLEGQTTNKWQDAVLAAIEKLGGSVGFDEKNPDKPVVDVELSGSKATDASLIHLRGLTRLQRLNLNATKVSDVGLEQLQNLASLKYLMLSGTMVTDAGLVHLKGLMSLHTLNLMGTKVTDTGLMHLKGLTSLQSLDLSKTEVTDAGLEHLKGLKSLLSLGLFGTKVTDAGLVHLRTSMSLQELNLNFTVVTDAGLVHLKGLTNLQELQLGQTELTDAGLEHLTGLSLRTLNLYDTEVTDAGLMHLKGLTSLRTLKLQMTKVTTAGWKDLRSALPKCKITK